MATNTTLIPEIWSDLDSNPVMDGKGNLKKVINIESVKCSVDNILRTYQGERVFLPEFASNLRGLLFEPINKGMIRSISDNIKQTIEIWDNRVNVVGVDISVDPDNSFVAITLRFQIVGYETIVSQTVNLHP